MVGQNSEMLVLVETALKSKHLVGDRSDSDENDATV